MGIVLRWFRTRTANGRDDARFEKTANAFDNLLVAAGAKRLKDRPAAVLTEQSQHAVNAKAPP